MTLYPVGFMQTRLLLVLSTFALLLSSCQTKHVAVAHSDEYDEFDEYYSESLDDSKIGDEDGISSQKTRPNKRPQVIQIPAKPPSS